MNDATVLVVGDVAWPIVVLILAAALLASQRQPIGRLIDRVRSFKVPGGSAELATSVPEGSADKIFALVDTLSRNVGEGADRVEAGVAAADKAAEGISNREPVAEFEPLPDEQVTGLVMLRTKATNLLAELAVPPPPGGFGPVSATIDVLVGRGVLDRSTAQALSDAVDIADQAARGATVPRRVAIAVENSGPAILEQLAILRTIAAARFEDFVLDTLQEQLPGDWAADIDRAITSDVQQADAAVSQVRHVRVDALVTAANRGVVIEVRARLQPGATGQIEAVRTWIRALPSDLPILLVMLGDGLTAREQRQIAGDRTGSVELLLWDREASSLIMTLSRMILGSEAGAAVPVPRQP